MIIAVDYASVDGNARPNFAEFKQACTRAGSRAAAVFFRVAWGIKRDLTAQRDWSSAQDAGLLCGGYLFLRMPQASFNATPEDQVHAFADTLGVLTAANMVPTIDVEDTAPGFSAEDELAWVKRAWTEMRNIYGVPPMIYDSGRVWHEDLHDLPAGEMTDSPQWVAKPWPWRVRSPAQLSGDAFADGKLDPSVPSPWGPGNWWWHQYQGDAYPVPGFSSTVDLSRFHLMTQGESGARVRWVQGRLGVATSGVFDAAMLAQVKEFQRSRGLAIDGVIGPLTLNALTWTPLYPWTLKRT